MDLCFQVWHVVSEDEKKLIGETIIQLSQLMMSENQTVLRELKCKEKGDQTRGKLKIQADAVKKSEDIIKF